MTYNTLSVSGNNIFGNSSGEVVTVTLVPAAVYFDTPNNVEINPPAISTTSASSGSWTLSGIIDPTPDGSGLAWTLTVADKTTGSSLYSAKVQLAYANGATQDWLNLTPPPQPSNVAAFMVAPTGVPYPGTIPVASGSGNSSAWGSLASINYDLLVASQNPAAWWTLKDLDGSSVAADDSGNGWTGLTTNVTFGAQGPARGIAAASFNGSTSKIATSFNPSGYTSLTLEAWVNFGGVTPTGARIFENASPSSSQDGYSLFVNGTTLYLDMAVSSTSLRTTAAGVASTGWQHLVATWDGTNVRLYVNGALVATNALAGTLAAGANGTWIGGGSGLGPSLNGILSECAIYPAALTAAQVSGHYGSIGSLGFALDSNASDIAWSSTTASAGATGLGADAGHSHPASISWFNVKNPLYGAKGNGSTDDTVAIQAAITAASAAGGVVYFPPGTYKISYALTIAAGAKPMKFIGDSQASVLIVQATASASIFSFTPSAGPAISDMYFCDLSWQWSSGSVCTAYAINIATTAGGGCTNWIFDRITSNFQAGFFNGNGANIGPIQFNNCTASNFSSVGTLPCINTINGAGGITCFMCVFSGYSNVNNGFVIDSGSGSVNLYNTYFTGFNNAVLMQNSASTSAPANLVAMNLGTENNVIGLNVQAGSGVYLSVPYLCSNTKQGILFGSGATGLLTVTGGTISGNGYDGIAIQGGAQYNISGAGIQSNSLASSGTYNGITVSGSASMVSVNGNTITNSRQKYGVAITGTGSHITTTGNMLSGNGTAGYVNSGSGSDIQATGNTS